MVFFMAMSLIHLKTISDFFNFMFLTYVESYNYHDSRDKELFQNKVKRWRSLTPAMRRQRQEAHDFIPE